MVFSMVEFRDLLDQVFPSAGIPEASPSASQVIVSQTDQGLRSGHLPRFCRPGRRRQRLSLSQGGGDRALAARPARRSGRARGRTRPGRAPGAIARPGITGRRGHRARRQPEGAEGALPRAAGRRHRPDGKRVVDVCLGDPREVKGRRGGAAAGDGPHQRGLGRLRRRGRRRRRGPALVGRLHPGRR